MRINALMPRFTDYTFKFLNKTMQKPAVNQLLTSRQLKKADDFAQHQGGPRAGSWVLVWVSLTQMCGGQPHPVGIQPFLFRPSPK